MRIVHYFINYNDSWYFPFIKKHYGSFCERIVCLDNYSTDNSEALAKELGFEFRKFGIQGILSDEEYLKVKNNVWKECKGRGIDYVIVSDADEFVCVPTIFSSPGFDFKLTTPIVIGYDMTSENLPVNDIKEVNTGFFFSQYSKQAIFDPDSIYEINYRAGCHENNMIGYITRDVFHPCILLHYRCIGGVQRLIDRQNEYLKRMVNNGSNGAHYLKSEKEKRQEWIERMGKAKILF